MLVRLAILVLFLFCNFALCGQDFADSIELEEVKIYGVPVSEYTTGSKIINIDSATMEMFASTTLADLLTNRSSVYLKTYGAGMVSTISFRGTSASHTAVLWNGININSASLGQSDFSTFPVLASNNVSIQFGSSSALYGSGAIGGSINLYSSPDWATGFEGSVQQDIGSFSSYYTGLSTKYGNGKMQGQTKLFYKLAENDFPYKVQGIFGTKEVKQQNAALKHYGLVQDFYYRIASNQYIGVNAWLNYLDREVQPSISSSASRDQQVDENVRIVANYHLSGKFGHLNPRLGYLYDVIEFNQSPSITQRYIAALQHEYNFSESLKLTVGVDNTYFIADIKGYGREVTENRTDVFTLLRYAPSDRLSLSANLRQSFVKSYKAPLSPSFGLDYNLASFGEYIVSWKANISRSYKIPTLNDRYWSPGGNPGLKSETGNNFEMGFLLKSHESGRKKTEVEVTAYSNYVDNWIIWLPDDTGTYWTPGNINKVHARGLEINSFYSNVFGDFQYSFGVDYAFTRSTNQNKEDRNFGEQLIYVPRHNGSIFIEGNLVGWFLRLNTSYTGSRYTTIDELAPFSTTQITIGKAMPIGKHTLTAFVEVDNLFDVDYFNYESHAMPGRNYKFSVKYSFKNKPSKQ